MKRTVLTGICVAGAMAASAFAQSAKPQATAVSPYAPPSGGVANGEIVWQQLPAGNQGFASQDFEPAYNAYDIQVIIDFNTSQNWLLGTTFATAFNGLGPPQGNGMFTTDVVARVWNERPWMGGTVVAETTPGSGVDNTGTTMGNISADFEGDALAAGNYYYSIQIARPFATGGQAFIYGLQPAVGMNDMQYNPGGGFGLCNGVWCTTRDANGVMYDVNFTLTGKPDSGGCEPCDANCDGTVDAFDIEPFIGILTGSIPNPCSACAGDADGSGTVDAFDIEPFITCLTGP